MATEVDEKQNQKWWQREKEVNVMKPDEHDNESESDVVDHMFNHRRLTSRQIQLLSIAGTVGAALFIAIGNSLRVGGPAALLLGFIVWTSVIFCVAMCQIEMVTLHPVDGSFIHFAGRFVDEAYGFATGYNYFISQAALICFDINIFNTVIGYWKDDLHPAILISVLIFTYFLLNIWSVSYYGEAEFWFALGKVVLILGMMSFTLVTMLGGNPQGDRYGFRYWKDPGAFVTESTGGHTGSLASFEGFVQCVIGAAFVIAGPEYISIVAGEAVNPRKTMPRAFKSIIYRLIFFFIGGALCVGIVVPYTSPGLIGGTTTAASSPYVIAMGRMGITILPDIVNALIATSIFSAANAYIFGTSRSLYGMALKGQAPRILTKLNRKGNPYLCVLIAIGISCLSYLSVSAGTAKVLGWWVSLVTASQILNWIIMSSTWLRFNNAMKKQNLAREDFLPYRSRFQPFAAWYALVMSIIVLGISGYTIFLPGNWATDAFIFQYGMVFVFIVLFFGWKALKRTKFQRGHEVDLTSGLEEIEAYTRAFEQQQVGVKKGFFSRLGQAVW